MQPMLDLRDWLASTQDAKAKRRYRTFKRRTGKVNVDRRTGAPIPGPYKFPVRIDILRKLLTVEAALPADVVGERPQLIGDEELRKIRQLWRTEEQDWDDSAANLLAEFDHRTIDWGIDDSGAFSSRDRELLNRSAESAEVPGGMIAKLLDSERQYQGLSRRSGIFKEIDAILGEDWLTHENEQELGDTYLSVRESVNKKDEQRKR